jgi:hypothetical protein
MSRPSPLDVPPSFAGPIPDLAWLARRLHDVGYVPENLRRLGALPTRSEWVPRFEARARCQGDDPLRTLVRVFSLGMPEDPGRLDDALGEPGLDALLECGIIVPDGDLALSRAWLAPSGDHFYARDFSPHITTRATDAALVLGVGMASLMAAHLTVHPLDPAGATALDVGTGQGFQAVQLAPHAERVVATDLSPRALAFARWSLGLCAVGTRPVPASCELRQGAFFEPALDLRGTCDAITTNPPFMIGPDPGVVAFSNGLPGDGVTERIARDAPAMLREGGYCTIVCNWHHDDDWAARPRAWLADSNCDAWLVRTRTHDTRAYALAWLAELDTPNDRITPDLLARWAEYYDRMGISAISFGALIIRKPPTPATPHAPHTPARKPFFRADTLDWNQSGGNGSAHIRRTFEALSFLNSLPDISELIHARLVPAPGLAVERTTVLQSGSWRDARPSIKPSGPLAYSTVLDDGAMDLLARLDGRTPLVNAVEAILGDLGGNRDAARAWAVTFARALLERGLLVPATSSMG